jgi:hypothetical protein
MTERLIENEQDRKLAVRFIENKKLPFRLTTQDGRLRSVEQNRLFFMWAAETAEQREGYTSKEVHIEWKARFALPILCERDNRFIRVLDLPYELKLLFVELNPVSSILNMTEMARMLDEIYEFHTIKGIRLTLPEDLRWNAPALDTQATR